MVQATLNRQNLICERIQLRILNRIFYFYLLNKDGEDDDGDDDGDDIDAMESEKTSN